MRFVKSLLIPALLIFPLLTLAQKPAAGRQSPYINYKYKGVPPSNTLPNGVKHYGGGLIGDFDSDPVYGVSQVAKGRTKMLWLEASTGRDESGVTGWQVHDVLSFPAMAKTDYLLITPDPSVECVRKGKNIPNLVGVGRILPRQQIFRPSKLWIANLRTKRFEPTSLSGVKCEYAEP